MEILPQLILNSIIAGSLYVLVGIGFTLVFSVARFFNLAHGILAAIGGYAVLYLAGSLGLNFYLSVLLGIVVAAAAGYALEFFVYKPLRARKASVLVLLIASLGAFFALQAFIAILFTSQYTTLSNLIPDPGIVHVGSGVITVVQVSMVFSAVVLFFLSWVILTKTRFGKTLRAVADDEEVARIVGIDTTRIIGIVFIIASALAGFAGIFVGLDTGLEPIMGLPLLLRGIIAAVVGGLGNVYGVFLGAYLLGFVENFGIWHISGEWKDTIAFVVLIGFMLFRPQGILGKK